MEDLGEAWVPDVCTLPAAGRQHRLAVFDELFTTGLLMQARVAPRTLRWWLTPELEAQARDLAQRETACCSFFQFEFTSLPEVIQVDVRVPTAQVAVLDAIAERAAGMVAA